MILENLFYKFIRPTMFALLAAGLAGGLIYVIGESLLKVADHEVTEELKRKDLWLGVGLTLGILAVAYLISRAPFGKLGGLDEPVAIGKKPMFPVELEPVDPAIALGPAGSVGDISRGYTLYAASGALARVKDVLRSAEDFNQTERTLIYAEGLNGVNPELWIPIEAVTSVYPDTQSAFLSVRGDEIEHFGWNRPPSSWVRKERPQETPLY